MPIIGCLPILSTQMLDALNLLEPDRDETASKNLGSPGYD